MTEDELDERLRRELRDLVAGAEPSPLLRKRIEERVGRMSHRRLPVRIGTMRLMSIAASVVLVIVPLTLALARGDGHGGKKKAKDLAVGQFTNNQDQAPGGGSGSSEGTAGRAATSPPKVYAQPVVPGTALGLNEVRPLLPPAPVPEGPSPSTTLAAQVTVPKAPPTGRVVFVSRRDGVPGERTSSLYAMNADGTGLSRLTTVPNEDVRGPAWSPDRSRIAFSTTRAGDGTQHVFVMDADGSRQTDLGPGSFPSFSADGRQIVFEDGNPSDLFLMQADGTGRRPLLVTPASEGAPAWSPDGKTIAFVGDADGARGLYTMGVDATGIRKMASDVVGAPAWSPDGRRIAFVSRDDGNLHVVNSDGTGDLPLTDDHSANAGRPAWSPDGRQVAFASIREGSIAIWSVDVDSRAMRRLTDAPNGDTDPAW